MSSAWQRSALAGRWPISVRTTPGSRGSDNLLTVDGYSYLEHMVRYTGAIVALLASFLAAPAATRYRWRQLRWAAASSRQRVVGSVRPVWDRFRGHGRAQGSTAQARGQASLGATAWVTATGRHVFPVDADAGLAERVERLERYIQTLSELHEMNRQAIADEKALLVTMLRNVEYKVEQEAAAIHSKIDSIEQTAMLVDARALPVIGIGIVLSSMSDLIAWSPVLSCVLFAFALTVLADACDHSFASADGR